MPMTTYTGETEIITKLGTTPAERGLETDEFKAKFDEGLKAFVTWFNDTHKTESDAHWAENAIDAHATIPACRVYHNANQSISNGSQTALAFNSERFDTDGIHDVSTNNTRLTCKTAGKYHIFAHALFAESTNQGVRQISIKLNGTTFIAYNQQYRGGNENGINTGLSISTIYDLSENDYVEVLVLQTSTAAMDILAGGNYTPEFGMIKVG